MGKFEQWLKERIADQTIDYLNELPFDSYDRWFAMYLIETESDILKVNASDELKKGNTDFMQFLNEKEKEMFEEESILAYENYERENISYDVALYSMLNVINQGESKELMISFVLTDSYSNGGWFGAS